MQTLQEGFTIMVLGMSFVFVFLVIMIFAMNICSKIILKLNKYFPEEVIEPKKTKKNNTNNDSEIALAIACALAKKRMKGE